MSEALRLFISHATDDSPVAERLATDLRAVGADVWLDATHLSGSGNFVTRISEALSKCDILVLLLSPAALRSQWVPEEMNASIVRHKQGFMRAPLIIMVDSVPLRDIPALWTAYNRIDATRGYTAALTQVLKALELNRVPTSPEHEVSLAQSDQDLPDQVDSPLPPTHATSSVLSPGTARNVSRKRKLSPRLLKRIGWIAAVMIAVLSIITVSLLIKSGAILYPGATVRWRFQTNNPIYATPVVSDGVVYISSGASLYALNASDGSPRWRFEFGGDNNETPALADGVVYTCSEESTPNTGNILYALNAEDGSLRWKVQTEDTSSRCLLGLSAPAVDNGAVYFEEDISSTDYVYAYRASDGSRLWKSQAFDGLGLSSLTARGNMIYASSSDGLYALSASDGSRLWKFQHDGFMSPTVDGNVIYASSSVALYALNAGDGSLRWKSQNSFSISDPSESNLSAPVPGVADGLVYVGSLTSSEGYLYAINTSDGSLRWRSRTGIFLGELRFRVGSLSSPAAANGVISVSSDDDFVYAFNAADGSLRWKFQAYVNSAPSIANGLVYIGSTANGLGILYALNA